MGVHVHRRERIAKVLVQEGAKVARGQVLARLDTSRLEPLAAAAALPARYAVSLLQTLYLAGDVESVIWLNMGGARAHGRRAHSRDAAGHAQAALLRYARGRLAAAHFSADTSFSSMPDVLQTVMVINSLRLSGAAWLFRRRLT